MWIQWWCQFCDLNDHTWQVQQTHKCDISSGTIFWHELNGHVSFVIQVTIYGKPSKHTSVIHLQQHFTVLHISIWTAWTLHSLSLSAWTLHGLAWTMQSINCGLCKIIASSGTWNKLPLLVHWVCTLPWCHCELLHPANMCFICNLWLTCKKYLLLLNMGHISMTNFSMWIQWQAQNMVGAGMVACHGHIIIIIVLCGTGHTPLQLCRLAGVWGWDTQKWVQPGMC